MIDILRIGSLCISIVTGILLSLPMRVSAAVTADNVCVQCHGSQAGRIGKPVALWRDSIHAENGIACNDCHGGDPKDAENAMSPARGFLGKPKEKEIPGFCGRCHVGVMKDYLASPHGMYLGKGGPTCVTCHGNHLVKKASLDLINEKDCSRCHSYERALAIRNAMKATETQIMVIETRLAEFKGRGVDTDQMGKSLFSLRNRFHTLFHELDIDRIHDETTAINNDLNKLMLAIKEIDETERKRKLAGIAVIAAALLASLLLRLYMKTFEEKPSS